MQNQNPIGQYSSPGVTVTLYTNRIEVKQTGCFFGSREVILFRNISSIERPPLMNCIDIKTNDGRLHRVSILNPAETNRLKEQLEKLL